MALAPKPLSLSFLSSLSSFPSPLPFQNPNSLLVFPKLHSRALLPTLIICKSTHTDAADYPLSVSELDGAGAAAPTRGDVFLQIHQSSAASATVLAETKKKKKSKDKAAKSSSITAPSCYGCGAPLQTSESDAPGYVEPETYSLVSFHALECLPEF